MADRATGGPPGGDRSLHLDGDVFGQVAMGDGNVQIRIDTLIQQATRGVTSLHQLRAPLLRCPPLSVSSIGSSWLLPRTTGTSRSSWRTFSILHERVRPVI